MTPRAKVAIATLLFHRGPPWSLRDHELWQSLSGSAEGLSPTVLNDLANAVLSAEIGPTYTTEKLP